MKHSKSEELCKLVHHKFEYENGVIARVIEISIDNKVKIYSYDFFRNDIKLKFQYGPKVYQINLDYFRNFHEFEELEYMEKLGDNYYEKRNGNGDLIHYVYNGYKIESGKINIEGSDNIESFCNGEYTSIYGTSHKSIDELKRD